MELKFKSLNSDLWQDFENYFEFKGGCSGCWCMNHRLPIGLDFEGEAAKLAMKQLVQTNRVFGVLAYEEGDSIPVGWASLDRRRTLPGHDCIGEDINCDPNQWSIHCVTSRSDKKNLGVEQKLIDAALSLAKEYGASEVEEYPEPGSHTSKPYKSWNTFNGHVDSYEGLGFGPIKKDFGEVGEFYCPMKVKL